MELRRNLSEEANEFTGNGRKVMGGGGLDVPHHDRGQRRVILEPLSRDLAESFNHVLRKRAEIDSAEAPLIIEHSLTSASRDSESP
jgi:hypothetical protein